MSRAYFLTNLCYYIPTHGTHIYSLLCILCNIYIYIRNIYNVPLLTSVDVVPLMKTAGVVENSGHCIYFIGLRCS